MSEQRFIDPPPDPDGRVQAAIDVQKRIDEAMSEYISGKAGDTVGFQIRDGKLIVQSQTIDPNSDACCKAWERKAKDEELFHRLLGEVKRLGFIKFAPNDQTESITLKGKDWIELFRELVERANEPISSPPPG